MEVRSFEAGGYRYVRGPFQYSAGVAADPGFALRRVRFTRPVPVARGFEIIEAHLREVARPLTAFCACELRSFGTSSSRRRSAKRMAAQVNANDATAAEGHNQ